MPSFFETVRLYYLPEPGMEGVWGDNSKKPAQPQTNLMRVPATSKSETR